MAHFNFARIYENAQRMKAELPKVLANQAKNYFVRSFTLQAWDGAAWKQVKRREPGTPEYKYPKFKGLSRRTSPILVRTGRLRRAVSDSIKIATWERILLVVEAPGAAAHNDGDASRNLAKRHFIGNSPLLDKELKEKALQYYEKIWHV